MKFARYLDDAQTPEWKRAYIDYRGLKKRITTVRRAQDGAAAELEPELETTDETDVEIASPVPLKMRVKRSEGSDDADADDEGGQSVPVGEVRRENVSEEGSGSRSERKGTNDGPVNRVTFSSSPERELSGTKAKGRDRALRLSVSIPEPSRSQTSDSQSGHALAPSRLFGGIRRRSSNRVPRLPQPPTPKTSGQSVPPTLSDLMESMPPVQLAFFDALDKELHKIERFFLAREAEARQRSNQLREQLFELHGHRKAFYAAQDVTHHRFGKLTTRAPLRVRRVLHSSPLIRARPSPPLDDEKSAHSHEKERERPGPRKAYDPEDYQHARKKLKRAVLEHYRGLEVLNNYRILNLTGFRKALKKFEKSTKIPVQTPYMKEKVDPCAFASDELVQALLKEMEDQFAARFAKGDKKRALVRLRAVSSHKTHHFSTLRTGLALGLAVPALVDGIVRSFQRHTRAAIPGWGSLLYIYAILAVPSMFACLVGLNLLVWSRSRINYVFIFELDIRTRLDHREYFEVPAIILAALSYCFWLSFARIGPPTTWPLIWLAFVAVMLVNPLPVFSRESRWWLIRNVARLLSSGWHRVEFTDFWMGDQFCSLIFTLGNLYFLGCTYSVGFNSQPDPWTRCSRPHTWAVPFVIASLPLLARLVQSIRRYADSKLITHLINGGKYGSGILYYLFYYLWRHNGGGRGPIFVLWCLSGTIYSVYALSWDLLMDWSVLRPHVKFPFLRSELVYSSFIPLYYSAIISNILTRFIWVLYIPVKGPSFALRTFIAAILEIFRRFQWNIYRLENEHLGNMDQYRVTREVPLPYSFDDLSHETDTGDLDDDEEPLERKVVAS